jgi:hypothetical protein
VVDAEGVGAVADGALVDSGEPFDLEAGLAFVEELEALLVGQDGSSRSLRAARWAAMRLRSLSKVNEPSGLTRWRTSANGEGRRSTGRIGMGAVGSGGGVRGT